MGALVKVQSAKLYVTLTVNIPTTGALHLWKAILDYTICNIPRLLCAAPILLHP